MSNAPLAMQRGHGRLYRLLRVYYEKHEGRGREPMAKDMSFPDEELEIEDEDVPEGKKAP